MKKILLAILLVSFLFCSSGYSQTTTHKYETLLQKIGPFNGCNRSNVDYNFENVINYQTYTYSIGSPGDLWIRLFFKDVSLGNHSYIFITSDKDGDQQKFNSETIKIWNNASAIFKGSSVTLSIHVASTDCFVALTIHKILIGSLSAISANRNQPPQTQSICGATDNRTSITSQETIGRWTDGGANHLCTGWLASNGAFFTAGHCDYVDNSWLLELNIPLSESSLGVNDGIYQPSATDDQYPVTSVHADENITGVGNDWRILRVGINSSTNLTPNEAQGIFDGFDEKFLRVNNFSTSSTIRISGCGIDNMPSGNPGPENAKSRTLQTSSGPFGYESIVSLDNAGVYYRVDTEIGNSGSPIILNSTNYSIGIHTDAGCDNTSGTYNHGTSFNEQDLEQAIEDFNGVSGDVYVDNGSTALFEDGNVFSPWLSINDAIANSSSGDSLYIVEGSYPETVIASKKMVFKAPVGLVVIGPNAPLTPALFAKEVSDEQTETVELTKPNWDVYPNPFVSTVHIKNKKFQDGNSRITLYNPLGQVIKVLSDHKNLRGTNYYENFDLPELSTGVYTLILENNDEKTVVRISKVQ